jgi:hypothetical protein
MQRADREKAKARGQGQSFHLSCSGGDPVWLSFREPVRDDSQRFTGAFGTRWKDAFKPAPASAYYRSIRRMIRPDFNVCGVGSMPRFRSCAEKTADDSVTK